jgi:hypothetical protein
VSLSGHAEVNVVVVVVLCRYDGFINHGQAWNVGKRSRVSGQVIEQRLLIEEHGSITSIDGVSLRYAKDASVLYVINSLRRNMTLLEEPDAEVDTVPSEIATLLFVHVGFDFGKV